MLNTGLGGLRKECQIAMTMTVLATDNGFRFIFTARASRRDQRTHIPA